MDKELKFDSPRSKSQMLLENSDWLAENVKGLDQSLEDMIELIKHDDGLLEDGGIAKQNELIAYIKEISKRHHLLSDRYEKLAGEFGTYVQTKNGINGSDKTTACPQSPLQVTPDKKIHMQDAEIQVADSDLCPSSGNGISDTTPNEGSESSFVSSDTDSETNYQTPYGNSLSRSHAKTVKHETADLASDSSDVDSGMTIRGHLHELKGVGENGLNLKLQLAEEEIIKLRNQLQNNEAALVKMGSLEFELESVKNKIKLHEAERENENARSLALQGQIVDLETKLGEEKKQVQDLKDVITEYSSNLSDRNSEIEKLKAELQDNAGSFALEKWQLESCISKLQEDLISHEKRAKELDAELELLYERNKTNEAEKAEMERDHQTLRKEWEDQAEAENHKKNELLSTLTDKIEGLDLKCNQLLDERDEIKTKVQCLMAEIKVYEQHFRALEQNALDLQSENKHLVAESEDMKKLIFEQNSRIEELEKEVEMQRSVMTERSEEKREAIRQLCFAIDHYKSAYEELRGAHLMRRRRTSPPA